jgi:hypothetical protein
MAEPPKTAFPVQNFQPHTTSFSTMGKYQPSLLKAGNPTLESLQPMQNQRVSNPDPYYEPNEEPLMEDEPGEEDAVDPSDSNIPKSCNQHDFKEQRNHPASFDQRPPSQPNPLGGVFSPFPRQTPTTTFARPPRAPPTPRTNELDVTMNERWQRLQRCLPVSPPAADLQGSKETTAGLGRSRSHVQWLQEQESAVRLDRPHEMEMGATVSQTLGCDERAVRGSLQHELRTL